MKQAKYDRYNSLDLRKQNWLNESKKNHNNKFDYSKINYINSRIKILIICPKHEEFWQNPTDHKNSKHGCPKCGQESNVSILRKNGVHKANGKRISVHNKSISTDKQEKINAKVKQTKIKNGTWIADEDLSKWVLYKRKVTMMTRNQELHLLSNIEKRAFGPGEYNLDHMYSQYEGFQNNIPPEIIGHISNLKMILFEENRKKYIRSNITLEELYRRIKNGEVD